MIIGKDRLSLELFNYYFEGCYWSMLPRNENGKMMWTKAELGLDPICVESRESTLRKTLENCQQEFSFKYKMKDLLPVPKNQQVRNAIYNYNMALGSKSIQNSVALLWTSLEALLPYRTANTDIESVQDFVSKTLSLGAISRDIHSFVLRFKACNSENKGLLNELNTDSFSPCTTVKGTLEWFIWLSEADSTVTSFRFSKMRECSQLLAYQYSKLGTLIGKGNGKDLLRRVLSSKESIQFQLQRIYLHRNQIVHSGDLVNEYMNVWLHLEWYIGKLLAYSMIKSEFSKDSLELKSIFSKLESDYDYLVSYFEKNPSIMITDAQRLLPALLNQPWQSF